MPNKFEKYDQAVEKFNRDYGVNFSFGKYEAYLNQTTHMRSAFAVNKQKVTAEDFAYRKVARELFEEAVGSMIMKKVNSVDHDAFLNDFDQLMDLYREHCKQTGADEPGKNGSWRGAEFVEDMQNKIRNIPTDKSDYVKNQYINRTLRLRDMRADIESMEKDGRTMTAEELSRVIVYQRALEKTIKERSFLWKATHWFQGPAEQRDLKMIQQIVGKYAHSIYNTPAEELADENVVDGVRAKLEAAKEEIKEKDLLKARRLKDEKQATARMNNPKVREHVSKQIMDALNESRASEQNKDGVVKTVLYMNAAFVIKMWKAFEKATSVEEKEKAIVKHTEEIFNENFKWISKLQFKKETAEHDAIVASQRITNLIMKQYTPATSERTYDKFCENYLVNDEKFMDGFMRKNFSIVDMSEKDLKDIISELNTDLADKKKIQISDADMGNKTVSKSEKHEDVPTLDARAKVQ